MAPVAPATRSWGISPPACARACRATSARRGARGPCVSTSISPLASPRMTVDRWVQSACVLCSNGCGMDIAVKDGKIAGVRGRAVDRVNHGRLGPKGLFGWQANNSPARLTRPLVRENGRLVESDWETAMGRIVERSRRQLADKGPLSIGFYTTGQFFIEEYYTLAVIGKAGIGTPHMDGNTRLCTATAAAALKENFGSDGQPGSYTDIDHADTFFHFGSNLAEQQTVLYMRCLDRRRGPNPPKFVVVDPRPTPAALEADLHVADQERHECRLHERHPAADHRQRLDRPGVHRRAHRGLRRAEADRDAVHAGARCGDLRRCPWSRSARRRASSARAERVLSTLLQGVYQSNQATAAACQVNNLHLIRGMIGKPGCGIFQMNGQPTSQNTRETGADGDLPGFRNWGNPEHIRELADLWNVDMMTIPHWSPPTHAMQIWRYAEQGSIGLLWISATNPAVSMPDLPRIRRILEKEDLFVVVQDAFLTETARYADVVLPAAIWGEKTGTFTNVDRTVHISDKAVEPPGEARTDLDIFLDYARPHGVQGQGWRAADQMARPGIRLRGVEGVQQGAALRLLGHDLRQTARRQRHPVAVHREGAGRHGAHLHGWALQYRPGLLRELRTRLPHRARRTRRRNTGR